MFRTILPLVFASLLVLPMALADTRYVYWGDAHLHTSLSLDASVTGTTIEPEQAYRFARGEEISTNTGLRARLQRPLDWLAITDHSDALGMIKLLSEGHQALLLDPKVQTWNTLLGGDPAAVQQARMEMGKAMAEGSLPQVLNSPDIVNEAWRRSVTAAEAYNVPGRFTTLIAYEWTATPEGNNLHRNVLFRDGAAKAGSVTPLTTVRGATAGQLWQWMSEYEIKSGGDVLAIAHNGNLSNGWMFPIATDPESGEPITRQWAETRARWEPLYEVTQMKGDGEAHPLLSPDDEFADFETWDRFSLGMVPKTRSMLRYEYAREALKSGLLIGKRTGINPYRFGLVGATDSHTGLSTADDDNFYGKLAYMEPSNQRVSQLIGQVGDQAILGWEQVASGYTGVWATSNTREAIFDALARREVYATTGPRIVLRFFGGWQFTETDLEASDFVETAYRKGVTMGSMLPPKSRDSASPVFLVSAMQDPEGVGLDRIQIVKGWLTEDGQLRETVFDVACSDGRAISKQRCARPAGEGASANIAGAKSLSAFWADPHFRPGESAVYYTRVIQVPSPRWSSYDAERFSIAAPAAAPEYLRERAYSSPIWYQP